MLPVISSSNAIKLIKRRQFRTGLGLDLLVWIFKLGFSERCLIDNPFMPLTSRPWVIWHESMLLVLNPQGQIEPLTQAVLVT